jgi:predicted heme/steroid binding protein
VTDFTTGGLERFEGRDGRPGDVAFIGVVCDVSASCLRQEGRHQAIHEAGRDLTDEIASAPHYPDFLEPFPVVGRLLLER